MSTTVTLVEELHRESANTSIDIRHLDAYASSARMNARLDEATAETHEAWRVAAHALLHHTLSTHTLSTHTHVPFTGTGTGTGKDVPLPLFVRVPPLYGLRGAGAYALDTDSTDSTDSTYATSTYSARTANASGGPGGLGGVGIGMGMGMGGMGMGGMGMGVGGMDGESGTKRSRTIRTIRAGSVGYSISARPLYHTHAIPVSLPIPLPIPIPIAIPSPVLKAMHVPATTIMPSMPSILAVLASAAVVPLEAGRDLDGAAF